MSGTDGHIETERSFAADEQTRLPDLVVGPVARVDRRAAADLVATYHDTTDLRLARSGVTVRRRTGGADEGWHVKVRAPDDPQTRLELHRPVGRSPRVPVALRRLLGGATRDAELVPVAEVATHREELALLNADGTVLAVVADDAVTSRQLGASGVDSDSVEADGSDHPAPLRWREVEVELAAGDADLLDRLTAVLHDAGLPDASEQSKLRRALGERLSGSSSTGADGTAAAVLGAQLDRLRTALVVRDLHVRAHHDDGVHQLRIAARRLRSVLAAYRPLLEEEPARRVEQELRWLGRELASARDLEVMAGELKGLLADEGAATAATRAVRRTLGVDHRAAATRVDQTLGAARHRRLMDTVAALADDPPWTGKSDRPAARVLRRRVAKTYGRLAHRMTAAEQLDGHDRDLALHAARKAAKRLRYALEVAEPAFGKPARRLRGRTKLLQQALGSHQDTVVLRALLRRLADDSADTQVAFTFGRLHSGLQQRAHALDHESLARWRRVTKPKARGWLG